MNFQKWLFNEEKDFKVFCLIRIDGGDSGSHGNYDGEGETPANWKDAYENAEWNFNINSKQSEELLKGAILNIDMSHYATYHEFNFEIEANIKISNEIFEKIKNIEGWDEQHTLPYIIRPKTYGNINSGKGISVVFESLQETIKKIIKNYSNYMAGEILSLPNAKSNIPSWVNLNIDLKVKDQPISSLVKKLRSVEPKPGETGEDYWTRQINLAKAKQWKPDNLSGD